MLQEHVQPNIGATASLEEAAAEVQQTLQRESYHEPEQPVVEDTASDARTAPPLEYADIAPEDFLGEASDGTILGVLELWSASVGPVKFQKWQSAYFGLLRKGFVDSEAFAGETRAEAAKRIRDMYNTIQTEVHGDDHVLQAVRKDQANRNTQGSVS